MWSGFAQPSEFVLSGTVLEWWKPTINGGRQRRGTHDGHPRCDAPFRTAGAMRGHSISFDRLGSGTHRTGSCERAQIQRVRSIIDRTAIIRSFQVVRT